jgi:hypothetical protein
VHSLIETVPALPMAPPSMAGLLMNAHPFTLSTPAIAPPKSAELFVNVQSLTEVAPAMAPPGPAAESLVKVHPFTLNVSAMPVADGAADECGIACKRAVADRQR